MWCSTNCEICEFFSVFWNVIDCTEKTANIHFYRQPLGKAAREGDQYIFLIMLFQTPFHFNNNPHDILQTKCRNVLEKVYKASLAESSAINRTYLKFNMRRVDSGTSSIYICIHIAKAAARRDKGQRRGGRELCERGREVLWILYNTAVQNGWSTYEMFLQSRAKSKKAEVCK